MLSALARISTKLQRAFVSSGDLTAGEACTRTVLSGFGPPSYDAPPPRIVQRKAVVERLATDEITVQQAADQMDVCHLDAQAAEKTS